MRKRGQNKVQEVVREMDGWKEEQTEKWLGEGWIKEWINKR